MNAARQIEGDCSFLQSPSLGYDGEFLRVSLGD